MDAETRIRKLERTVKRLYLLFGSVMVLVMTLFVWRSTLRAKEATPRYVDAKVFRVIDDSGKVSATFGMTEMGGMHPALEILNKPSTVKTTLPPSEKARIYVNASHVGLYREDEAVLSLDTSRSESTIQLGYVPVKPRAGIAQHKGIRFHLDRQKGKPEIQLFDLNGKELPLVGDK